MDFLRRKVAALLRLRQPRQRPRQPRQRPPPQPPQPALDALLPASLVDHIASFLPQADACSLRLASLGLAEALRPRLEQAILHGALLEANTPQLVDALQQAQGMAAAAHAEVRRRHRRQLNADELFDVAEAALDAAAARAGGWEQEAAAGASTVRPLGELEGSRHVQLAPMDADATDPGLLAQLGTWDTTRSLTYKKTCSLAGAAPPARPAGRRVHRHPLPRRAAVGQALWHLCRRHRAALRFGTIPHLHLPRGGRRHQLLRWQVGRHTPPPPATPGRTAARPI